MLDLRDRSKLPTPGLLIELPNQALVEAIKKESEPQNLKINLSKGDQARAFHEPDVENPVIWSHKPILSEKKEGGSCATFSRFQLDLARFVPVGDPAPEEADYGSVVEAAGTLAQVPKGFYFENSGYLIGWKNVLYSVGRNDRNELFVLPQKTSEFYPWISTQRSVTKTEGSAPHSVSVATGFSESWIEKTVGQKWQGTHF